MTPGEIAKAWRERASLSTEEVARRIGTSRQNLENFEGGRTQFPKLLPALARFMGYARTDDLLAGLPPPASTGQVAHAMSQLPYTMLPRTTWESILEGEKLPEVFILDAPDDSMAPAVRVGTGVIWSTTKPPQVGSVVLVRDKRGQVHMRRIHEGPHAGRFLAVPKNPAFRTLDRDADELQVVAVWAGRLGDFEDFT